MARTFLYLDEVARECRTSVSTVRHWIAVGRLRSVRPGRRLLITRDDLDSFLDASERKPRAIEREVAPVDPRQLALGVAKR